MVAKIGTTDLSSLIGYGYSYSLIPQCGETITTMDGKEHAVKIRDRVKLTVPFIALTLAQINSLLALFPANGAYVNWTFYDPNTGSTRTAEMKYSDRLSRLACVRQGGTELYTGLVLELIER